MEQQKQDINKLNQEIKTNEECNKNIKGSANYNSK